MPAIPVLGKQRQEDLGVTGSQPGLHMHTHTKKNPIFLCVSLHLSSLTKGLAFLHSHSHLLRD